MEKYYFCFYISCNKNQISISSMVCQLLCNKTVWPHSAVQMEFFLAWSETKSGILNAEYYQNLLRVLNFIRFMHCLPNHKWTNRVEVIDSLNIFWFKQIKFYRMFVVVRIKFDYDFLKTDCYPDSETTL